MNSANYFKIFNASAGTGKTFNLVKDYLILILKSKNIGLFKKILAITFTNKAVNEMKRRIINYLINFSNSTDPDFIMMNEIIKETKLSQDEIFLKSSKILNNILKNYSAFEISTIDKFTQKIVRSFTYELGIDSKYEVEIDQIEILNMAIDNLISKVEIKKDNSKELINFSFEKTDQDKSWDITLDLQNFGKIIFNENNYEELELLKNLKTKDFNNCKIALKSLIKKNRSRVKILANSALELINQNKINHKAFPRQNIPNHFIKISEGDFANLYKNRIEENLNKGTLNSSTANEIEIYKIENIRNTLLNIYKRCKTKVFKIKLYENILNNLSPVSILSQVRKEIDLLKREENFILISEFNKIVNNEIRNQPALFIYEKIGTKFNHYFIDEFQDTSKLQWENLRPLIENTLSSENSSLTIAGDPKQSIYSWRGGDVDGFMKLINKESPFYCEKFEINLNENFRSSQEIVNFNNNLFKHISNIYSNNHGLLNILDFPKQTAYSKERGYININFCDNNISDKKEYYNSQTLKNINDIIKRGYCYKDICIIVRKKKEGVAIGDFLTENEIPIISSEVLNLNSSPKVNLIVNLINFSISKSEINKVKLCKSLSELGLIKIPLENFLIETIDKSFNQIKKHILIENFDFDLNKLKGISIYEAVEYIIDEFKLIENGNSYVQFFLDFSFEYVNKFKTSLVEFIEYYDEIKEKLNIVSPQEINAVEIMTIHKSKGLEFPIVIYPYANINIYGDLNPKAWIDTTNHKNINLKKILVSVNKDLEQIDHNLYYNYLCKLEIDNINLLYVTLTRAKQEIYIISEKNVDSKGNEKIKMFSGIFISYLKKINIWDESKLLYEIGEKINKKTHNKIVENLIQNEFVVNSRRKHNIIISSKNSNSWINDFDIAKEEGNIFHDIMSKIYSSRDINIVLNKFFELGNINLEQKNKYEKMIFEITNHLDLIEYFNENLISFNEREIISGTGKNLIPDRLTFLNKDNLVIIEYKTGLKNHLHINQLKKYERILQEMNLNVIKKILVYINKKIEVDIY